MLKAPGLSCSVRKISNKLLFANNDLLIKPYELPGNSHYYIEELSLTFRVCHIFSHIFSLSHYYMNTPIYALLCNFHGCKKEYMYSIILYLIFIHTKIVGTGLRRLY